MENFHSFFSLSNRVGVLREKIFYPNVIIVTLNTVEEMFWKERERKECVLLTLYISSCLIRKETRIKPDHR